LLFREETFELPLVAHRPAVEYQTTDPSRPDYSPTGPYIPVNRLEGDYYLYAALEPVSFERYYRWFSHIEDFPPRVLPLTPCSAALQYAFPEASVQTLQSEYRAVGFLPDVAFYPFIVRPGTGRQIGMTCMGPVSGWTLEALAGFEPGATRTVTLKNRDGSEFRRSGWIPEFDATFWVNPSRFGFLDFYWDRFVIPCAGRLKFFWSDEGCPYYPDYEPRIRDMPHRSVFEGMLSFFSLAHANGYAQINNLYGFIGLWTKRPASHLLHPMVGLAPQKGS